MASELVRTVSQVVTKAVASPTPTSAVNKVPPQGGVLEGANPVHYDSKNPIIIFIIQAGIIIIFCRLLHYPLSKLRQPRVIAEVIGGILLGPSVMGRIPGFTAAIFPTAAMPNLNLIANIGLTLFLFLVGLEVDLRFLVSNWKIALSVGLAGMALPFGLGCAIAVGLYDQFRNEPGTVPIDFGVYMLFIGVAMAITAFPVLCRILTELKLLMTPVGIIVLSAGVGNDVVGWVLLALCVALVNAGTGLTALWVLLTCIGYVLVLVYAVRPAFVWVLRRNRALQDGPSQGDIALTLLIALTSAFFTGIIGVHPIFGAFMAGLICPHEGGFAIKVTEKIEDLVSALFLPLYFALSGLNTNLGLLDSGIVWGYVFGVCAIAFFAKFVGAALAARVNGMVWRECFTIGSLMSCKGLVELIVLNIGLQAKILSTRTFTIFVVMALVTTFATTPLTSYLYPPWYQKKIEAWKRGEIDWDTGKPLDRPGSAIESVHFDKLQAQKVRRLMVYLRLDSMPTLLAFASLFGGKPDKPAAKRHPLLEPTTSVGKETEMSESNGEPPERPIEAYGLRLLSLTDRGSSVMQVSELESYTAHDPVVNTFRTFGRLHNLAISGEVVVVPEPSFADVLTSRASESDLLLLPWSETGGMSEQGVIQDKTTRGKLATSEYTAFVHSSFEQATITTAVLVNKNFGGSKNKDKKRLKRTYSSVSLPSTKDQELVAPIADRSHHIFLPFFGGDDDRAALRLVLQLAENPEVTATLVHFEIADERFGQADTKSPVAITSVKTTAHETVSATPEQDSAFFAALRASLPTDLAHRVVFETVPSADPVEDAIARASAEVGQSPKNAGDLVVLGRNASRTLAGVSGVGDGDEITRAGESLGAASTLGGLAEKVWEAKVGASLLVVKAGVRAREGGLGIYGYGI
ncbi:K(+)/H(+) antiporter-like protein 1 [Delitschia confertaspora ATCC 74209]|uniref:K(+)/H(+) antiporter-like protein 1 n=1 Tax=Delitschia confertaspora ATCC 74209 TaxID=1513339 RepID=A0A9P4JPV5_9PLEO|nr:K(+)/H(+) antiporter-like protein 1 [Delitschia confertaspora ATCC 74209]